MKDNTTKMAIMLIILFALAIGNSIINDSVNEYLIALFITLVLSYVISVVKGYIFTFIIRNDKNLMLKKINVIFEFSKLKTYEDYLNLRNIIIEKYNSDYYSDLYRFFYFNYNFDIKKYGNFDELLRNEQKVIDEIIKTINHKKEKEYKLLKKNFKVIRKNIDHDRNFQNDYLEWKSGIHTKEFNNNINVVILSVITIISFLISVSVSVINVDINLLIKVTISYTIMAIFMQSFMAVLDFSTYRIGMNRKLESIMENLLEGVGDNE